MYIYNIYIYILHYVGDLDLARVQEAQRVQELHYGQSFLSRNIVQSPLPSSSQLAAVNPVSLFVY